MLQFEFIAGAILTFGMGVLVLLSGVLFPDGGQSINLVARLTPPFENMAFPLGTDPLGRDILERIILGRPDIVFSGHSVSFWSLDFRNGHWIDCRLLSRLCGYVHYALC